MNESERPIFAIDLSFDNGEPEGTSATPVAREQPDVSPVGPPIPAIRPVLKTPRAPSSAAAADVDRLLTAAGVRTAQRLDVMVTTPSGSSVELTVGRSLLIGRSPSDADLVVDDPTISRRHCRVTRRSEDEVTVEDLASANGTWLHREESQIPLEPGRPLRAEHGDWIRSGPDIALAHIALAPRSDGESQ